MIPDDMLYNPGHLRNCDLPNHALDGRLPDSFSVPGTHSFPTGFFDAKYVITADPFPLSLAPDTELGHRFERRFSSAERDYPPASCDLRYGQRHGVHDLGTHHSRDT